MTVLVPVYCGAADIGAAVESVLAQTFGDFELLIVDDASPDDSLAIVSSFGDPRIRVLHNERNLGQVASLNRGLQEALGAYVARLDQDDRCLPERLARQVAVLDAEPSVALVGTWMTVVDEDGNRRGRLAGELSDHVDFVFACLVGRIGIGHPTVMFRRDLVVGLGGYDTEVGLAEDMDLWRRIALAGHEARIVPEPLVVYRSHSGSQSLQRAREQQANDDRALEGFLAELSPGAPPRLLRLLLGIDEAFWAECRSASDADRVVAALERLLSDAGARLRLDDDQAAKLDRLVRARVGLAAARSWRAGARAYRCTSAPLWRFSSPGARMSPGAAAVYALAPLLHGVYVAGWSVLGMLGAPGRLEGPKRLARRFPWLTAAYSRLRGGR